NAKRSPASLLAVSYAETSATRTVANPIRAAGKTPPTIPLGAVAAIENLLRVRLEEYGHFRLAVPPLGDPDDELDELVVGRSNENVVHRQKHQRHRETNALVAIDERVVFNEMKEIGGPFLI